MEYGKLFAAKDYLKGHQLRLHTKSILLSCDKCNKSFTNKEYLKQHQIHQKQRNRILATSVSLFLARFQI